MPCITEEPEMPWVRHVEMMLEQAFRYLTKEQILSIKGLPNSGWLEGYQWYKEHLLMDFCENYKDEIARRFYENEANRLGLKLTKIDGGASIN